MLVVLVQVHSAALTGVHQLLFGDAGGGLLGLGGSGSLGGCLLVVVLGLGTTVLAALTVGTVVSCHVSLLLFGGCAQGSLHVSHLVLLGDMFKNQGQLLVVQHLHMIFRGGSVSGQDLGDLLGGLAEILGYLMNAILF